MPPRAITANTLFYGDNLRVLRESIPDASIDLITLDPPFDARMSQHALFKDESSQDDTTTSKPIQTFDDVWHWNAAVAETYDALVADTDAPVARVLAAQRASAGTCAMTAFVVMMAARLLELHRVLKPTGSLYLHCDSQANQHLKSVIDAIFGPENYRNAIVWQRTASHSDTRSNYGKLTDSILYYTKSRRYIFNPQYASYDEDYIARNFRYSDPDGRHYASGDLRSPQPRPNLVYDYKGYHPHPNGWAVSLEKMQDLDRQGRLILPKRKSGRIRVKRYLDELPGRPPGNIWDDIPPVSARHTEHLGFATQKPRALLERIIATSSNKGDWVLDPFCGCGTAVAAAQKLERRWIGIDVTYLALLVQSRRLRRTFPDAAFDVVGAPQNAVEARALAARAPAQFAWWVLSLVNARPRTDDPLGRPPSGIITFIDAASNVPKRALVRVTTGAVTPDDIHDARTAVERGDATLVILVTPEAPMNDIKLEAKAAGRYPSPGWGRDYPRVQILTVDALLRGEQPQIPPGRRPRKSPKREQELSVVQKTLELSTE